MKVCHFTSAHNSDDIRIFHKECVSLAEAGHEVFLVSAQNDGGKQDNVQRVSADSKKRSRIGRMVFTSREVYKKAFSLNAEIYHFHDPELLRFASRLKRKGKIVIYDAHEDLPRQIMAKFWIPKLFRKFISVIFEKYENYIASKLSAVVVSTPHIKSRFLKINKSTQDVCNYPMLKELMDVTPNGQKNIELCYVGGISEVRGINQLLDAMKLAPEFKLNLAGNFSGHELEQKIKTHPQWDKVIFHGYVGRQELLSIFSCSKVGIVTLLSTPNHLNSLPIKMFEYMSAGIPVVCSDFPLWKEIIEGGKCGVSVNPENPDEIIEAAKKILNNPELAEEMGRNGKKMVIEKYNWEMEKLKLIDLYQSLSSIK